MNSLIVTPETAVKQNRLARIPGSVWAWLLLVAYLVVVKFVLTLLPPINVSIVAREFSWSTIALYGTIGFLGVLLSLVTGFPDALDQRISNRQRFLLPVLAGAGLGTLAVSIDLVTHGTKFIEAQTGEPSFNVYFPASLFVYSGGVVLVEAVFRMFVIPFFLWLISNMVLRKRGQEQTFWVLAVLLSLFEPVVQGLAIVFLKPSADPGMLLLTQFLPYFITNYPLNLGQAAFFRKYGFLASFTMRLGFYMVWHVIYGSLLYPMIR